MLSPLQERILHLFEKRYIYLIRLITRRYRRGSKSVAAPCPNRYGGLPLQILQLFNLHSVGRASEKSSPRTGGTAVLGLD